MLTFQKSRPPQVFDSVGENEPLLPFGVKTVNLVGPQHWMEDRLHTLPPVLTFI